MCGGTDLLGGGLAFEVLVYETKGKETQLLQQLWTEPGYNAVKENLHSRRAHQSRYGKNIMWDAIPELLHYSKVCRVVH